MANPNDSLGRQLAELRERITELSPEAALQRVVEGAILLDIREPDELADGTPRAAQPVPRGMLELRIGELAPTPDTPLMLLCGSGVRSLLAADTLQRLGYQNVASVAGGFEAWRRGGLAVRRSPRDDTQRLARYARQLRLPGVGEAGQARLDVARVLLVGAGGLGSPAALYLAAAGVGTLGIADDDIVERSNLQRQILHRDATVGTPKVYSAQAAIAALNPDVRVVTHRLRVTAENAAELIGDYDIVLDGSDNFATRYALNDACASLQRPLVHAAVYRFEGQASVLWPARGGPCYRCVFPEPPPAELAPSCSDAGVLGVLPGLLGTLQATEALKILLEIGASPLGRLLCVDALSTEFRSLRVAPDPDCPICAAAAPAREATRR